jgi:hypothetical protein
MPLVAEGQQLVDIPITVHPLAGKPGVLAGTPVVLRRPDDHGRTWFGRLNQRGQILFRDMEPGTYQARIVLPALTGRKVQPDMSFTALPNLARMLVAAAGTEKRRWRHTYRNAGSSLKATLQKREAGDLELSFETKQRDWDGTLVGFRWKISPDKVAEIFAPLSWSEGMRACVAQVNLSRIPELIEAPELPEQPMPPHMVGELPASVIRDSVARAAWALTRRAWHRLLEEHGEALSSETRDALQEALAQIQGSY